MDIPWSHMQQTLSTPLYVLEEQPRCIGGADSEALKPIYEQCGLGCYSILVTEAEIN